MGCFLPIRNILEEDVSKSVSTAVYRLEAQGNNSSSVTRYWTSLRSMSMLSYTHGRAQIRPSNLYFSWPIPT
jgi:hypothetical protein